jgi:hypothetical protein
LGIIYGIKKDGSRFHTGFTDSGVFSGRAHFLYGLGIIYGIKKDESHFHTGFTNSGVN